ncbi:MAG TPA: type II toxin-antitoxin system VapC family toxin [Vicinamibacteria bacterium]|nr:type II toxin-antitoxin system VapC family toxin [Vicinamibacteria bacterium]
MKLLLDTHALLWWSTLDGKLSRKAKRGIASENNDVFVSAASAWEIATKARIGKLEWPATAGTVNSYVLEQGFRALPISLEHAERAGQLQINHRDPFDRMLIAQALAEDMWLASNEDFFDRAGVRRYW